MDTQAQELNPEAVFTDRKNRRARGWRFFLSLVLLIALGTFGYSAWQWFYPRLEKFGLSVLWINGKVFIILLPLVLLLLFWLFFANLPRKKTTISIFPDGIRKQHGSSDLKLRWDSLEKAKLVFSRASFLGIPGRRKEKMELIDAIGNKLAIEARMDRFEELVNRTREKAFPFLANFASEQLSKTGKLTFGKKIVLSQDTLTIGNSVLPLSQISSTQVEKGWLKLTTDKHRKQKIRVDRLENLDVLLHLLGELS